MDDLNEIIQQLDKLYDKYKRSKSQLNNMETEETANLIVKMTVSPKSSISSVVNELARFSADVCNLYFTRFLQTAKPPVKLIDELISSFIATDTDKSKSQHYIQKYVYISTSVIKNCGKSAFESKQLPKLVNVIARYAVTSEKQRKKFQTLINNSNGLIYLLDFTETNENNLKNIWNVTTNLYPDLSKAKYEDYIKEWAEKYGFIDSESTESHNIEIKEENVSEKIAEKVIPAAENTDTENYVLSVTQNLYTDIHKEIIAETENVKSAINDVVSPLWETINNFQKELNKISELVTTNVNLQAKITELEQQLSKANQHIYADLDYRTIIEAEKNILQEKIKELDEKLKEAYSINSRESSLEAERIKNEISKSLAFCYEDWLEYKNSDYSEENYESLQAVIKRIFRAIEKNGIKFKGNNE